jgi:hypothetical protein
MSQVRRKKKTAAQEGPRAAAKVWKTDTMRTLADSRPRGNENLTPTSTDLPAWIAANVVSVVSYVDSVELFCEGRVPTGTRRMLEAALGKRLRIDPCKSNGYTVGYRVVVHQPSIGVLQILDQLVEQHEAKLYRADIATDWCVLTSLKARQLARALKRYLLLRWRRRGPMRFDGDDTDEETTHWINQNARRNRGKRRSARDVGLYSSKPSKITGLPCAHLELKFYNSRAVRAEGWHMLPSHVAHTDPGKLFGKHLRLCLDFEPWLKRTIKKQVKLARAGDPDLDGARLAARYRWVMENGKMDCAQWLKDNHPKAIKTTHPVDVLRVPKSISWDSPIHNISWDSPIHNKVDNIPLFQNSP